MIKRMQKLLCCCLLAVLLGAATAKANYVSYWNFNQSNPDTTLNDFTGLYDGTAASINFVPSGAGILGVGMGNAGDFSLSSDYITLIEPSAAELGDANGLNFGTGDFTITGWFKHYDVSAEDYYHMIYLGGSHNVGGVNVSLARGARSYRGKVVFDIKGTTNISIMSDARCDDDQWHWFAAVVSSQVASIYVDGVLQTATATYGAGTTADTPVGFGRGIGQNYWGQIDEIKAYDTALSGTLDANNTLVSGELYDDWNTQFSAVTCEEIIASGYTLAGDTDNDCDVDMTDLKTLISDWLSCSDPQIDGCIDLVAGI